MTNQKDLNDLQWQCVSFAELSNLQLHAIYQARAGVFIIEQNCVYQDVDGKDPLSHHLTAWTPEGEVAAYLRIVPAGIAFTEASLGRVISTKDWRGTGVGKALIANGIKALHTLYPAANIRIGAQAYLEKFYGSFGFETVSDIYLEDDIPHVEMLWTAKA
ncbi:GNAT family N-acetyltransferase [Undibacterium sp. Ji50W]|uniref:GNAT family N-acetyltransferase n=1 Tax=Undibacterium sp. Ji50W TaxID=3413041 RepID=UPI003BF307CF